MNSKSVKYTILGDLAERKSNAIHFRTSLPVNKKIICTPVLVAEP